MKKILLTIFVLISSCMAFTQGLPQIDRPGAYVFDLNTVPGKAKDYIKVKNESSASNFSITVYGYKDEEWVTAGTGFLKTTI
ncbi:hypothetical protein [Treponema sp.]|uniref:hypothetical protein n=1 Tax=Treponema sp. TaxID=166 RepID=UPI0025E28929|nr:hypothetical protein [Treponema sp.]MCR5218145.1 hypothetical protein [Treponema sp.]